MIDDDGDFDEIDQPRDCTWPPPEVGEKPNCWAKKNFTRSSMIEMKIIICPMLAIESIEFWP